MADRSPVRIGARSSHLSRRQADLVAALLRSAAPALRIEIVLFTTDGDRQLDTPLPLIGGKGVFTLEIEEALRDGRIDFAVHSLKDLPTAQLDDLVIGAVPLRGDVADALISRSGAGLMELPTGATVGTSSHRRAAQIVRARADLRPVSIRGNVETRLAKAADPAGGYDAIVLAQAGLERLGRLADVTESLPLDVMLPAPGQGALAVQCRIDSPHRPFLALIHDPSSGFATTAERSFLAALGGGCSAPIAAHGQLIGDRLRLRGRVLSVDGVDALDVESVTRCSSEREAKEAGRDLAVRAITAGATRFLEVGRR